MRLGACAPTPTPLPDITALQAPSLLGATAPLRSTDPLAEHKDLMAKFPEMEHDDPNAIRLQPGETGTIVWTFANAGGFEFACLIPGHYEAGMHGALTVN